MYNPTIRAPARFWANRSLAIKGLVVIALPLAVLLGSLLSLYLASNAEARAEDDVRRAFAIQRDTYQVHALLAEAAAGVRGYVLTGDNRFLAPFRKAQREVPSSMARLDEAIEDPIVRDHFEELRVLEAEKRTGLQQIVDVARVGNIAEANVEDALLANKLALDEVRVTIDDIQRREAVVLDERRTRVEEVRAGFLILTAVSALVGLLGSLSAVYLFSTGIVRRVRKLEGDAEALARGERLTEMPEEADEVGRLAQRLVRASALLHDREDDLRASEERFRLVIEKVRDYGIFALDPDGMVTSWNLGAERIKGWRAEDILGRHFSNFYPTETRDHLPEEMLERARENGSAEDEGWRIRKDGSRFWANVVITALRDEQGKLRGFAKVTRDMTERRRSEEALKEARKDAEAASRAKSEFLSRTSHELRTPLNAILGFGQLLEIDEDDFARNHREAIGQITKAGRHLLSLINDLLDIASIEAGSSDLTIETLDLGQLLEEAYSLGKPIVASANLNFELERAGGNIPVRGDARRVTQIILNLIGNAAKYNRDGTFVRLGCRFDGALVRVTVEDDGPGIAEAEAKRLFTPFDRLGQQDRAKIEGTGLGLALSKSLAESMDGGIGFEALAKGSRFWFSLARAAQPENSPLGRNTNDVTESSCPRT
ncbi:PAS domain S-box protein [Pelagerythrobacter aerophilus]|uniref:histidine kinase n=1 Tax=Pelagerythrobacter aerophilus TaxID=2306995 RepID=A0A418NKD3_9SPHN|nr:PAS domain S-box protein [Pelagerythrobacter aerophilus]